MLKDNGKCLQCFFSLFGGSSSFPCSACVDVPAGAVPASEMRSLNVFTLHTMPLPSPLPLSPPSLDLRWPFEKCEQGLLLERPPNLRRLHGALQ